MAKVKNQNVTATTTNSISSWNSASTISGYTTSSFTHIEYKPTPFNITFAWDGKEADIILKNGNDIFKLAKILMKLLDDNNVEYNVKTKKKRK